MSERKWLRYLKFCSVLKHSKASIPQNSTHTTPGVCIPFISLSFYGRFGCIFFTHTSSSYYLRPFFECSMCYSFLIRFRHFFSLTNSFPSDSFLFFLFRFIGVKGHYHVLLPGCVSLNGGDTKPLVITVLALWRTLWLKCFIISGCCAWFFLICLLSWTFIL